MAKRSAAQRRAMSKAQKLRRKRENGEGHPKAAPAASVAAKATVERKRSGVMPHGITVLRRNGRGRDIIEGDADEIRRAIKLFRMYRKNGD